MEAVPGQDFRQERINILDHTAIVLTSRNSVDHFFRMCKELRLTVPETHEVLLRERERGLLRAEVHRVPQAQGLHRQADLRGPDGRDQEAQGREVPGALQRHPEREIPCCWTRPT
jgi:hypothetical protein